MDIYGLGMGQIYGYHCDGSESSLSSCDVASYSTLASCSHSDDVSLECEGNEGHFNSITNFT